MILMRHFLICDLSTGRFVWFDAWEQLSNGRIILILYAAFLNRVSTEFPTNAGRRSINKVSSSPCRLWQCAICARNSTTTTRLQPPHRLMLISVGGWRATASVGRRAKWSGPKQDEEEGKTIIKASRHVLTFISKRLSDSRFWTPPATSARFKQPSRKKCTLQSMHYDVKMISEHRIGANYKLQANYIAHCTNQVTCIILPEVPYWW